MDTAAGQVNVDVHEHFSINNHYSEKFECSIFSYHFQITYMKGKSPDCFIILLFFICYYSLSLPPSLQTASSPQTRLVTSPPAKKIKRVNGYNLFFSDTVRSGPEISTGMTYTF